MFQNRHAPLPEIFDLKWDGLHEAVLPETHHESYAFVYGTRYNPNRLQDVQKHLKYFNSYDVEMKTVTHKYKYFFHLFNFKYHRDNFFIYGLL